MKKQPLPSNLIALEHAFRALLLGMCIFANAIPTAQAETIDPCGKVLIEQIDYYTLNGEEAYAYLSQVDNETWDRKKKDAGFIGKWQGFLGPMSGNFSYDQFDAARKRFFKSINYNASSATAVTKLRRYNTPDQLEKWEQCNKNRGWGLSITKGTITDEYAKFELRWIAPPGGAVEVPITDSDVTGGSSRLRNAPKGKIFPDGDSIKQGTRSFTITREPSKPVTVSVDAGGFTDSVEVDAPTLPPAPISTPTATPLPKKSFEVLGVRHKDKSIGKYFGFDAEDLDAILGRTDWNGKLIDVSLNASGPFRKARVWRSSNGTAGTAHGRYEEDWKQGDWHKGDFIYVSVRR